MQSGNLVTVRVPAASLAMALAHGGGAAAVNIALPFAVAQRLHGRCKVQEIHLWSTVAIKFGVQFFSSAAGVGGATIDAETYLGEWQFGNTGLPGDGGQATGDTFFYYAIAGIGLAYKDTDATSPAYNVTPAATLHFRIVNWDAATDKAAAANLVLEFVLEPTKGN